MLRPCKERDIPTCHRFDRFFVKRGKLLVRSASFLARRRIRSASFNLLSIKKIIQVHQHLSRLGGALPCRPRRRLDQRSPCPAFRRSLQHMDPPIGSAHEGGELLELIRLLAELKEALAAERRWKGHATGITDPAGFRIDLGQSGAS
jgi:hypothetical protein